MYRHPRHHPLGERHHILLIEDNADGRESLRMLLTLMGHQVDVAADGVEGVQRALASHPDIAIVDIGLPRMDGYQVARRIRAAFGRHILLIAYTAYDHADTGRLVAEAGFDAHLVKPVDLEELTSWLDSEPMTSSALCSTSS